MGAQCAMGAQCELGARWALGAQCELELPNHGFSLLIAGPTYLSGGLAEMAGGLQMVSRASRAGKPARAEVGGERGGRGG